jgi:hypothetical protein
LACLFFQGLGLGQAFLGGFVDVPGLFPLVLQTLQMLSSLLAFVQKLLFLLLGLLPLREGLTQLALLAVQLLQMGVILLIAAESFYLRLEFAMLFLQVWRVGFPFFLKFLDQLLRLSPLIQERHKRSEFAETPLEGFPLPSVLFPKLFMVAVLLLEAAVFVLQTEQFCLDLLQALTEVGRMVLGFQDVLTGGDDHLDHGQGLA